MADGFYFYYLTPDPSILGFVIVVVVLWDFSENMQPNRTWNNYSAKKKGSFANAFHLVYPLTGYTSKFQCAKLSPDWDATQSS